MQRFNRLRFRMQETRKRWQLAWRFATNRLTRGDASRLAYHADIAAQCYPLVSIGVDDVMDLAENVWESSPALRNLAEQATRRVWNKWNSSGDELNVAQDWAIELIREYAQQDGIALTERA